MKDEVYKLLNQLNIQYDKIEHPPLFTGKDNEKYKIKFDAIICKNLFIRNSNKSQYYLFTLPIEKTVNLKSLQILLEETRLSFGNENILEEKLGIKAGAVSIFNIINMKENDVIFILDKEILKYEKVAFHPNVNTETVIFNPKELNKILQYYHINYQFITI